MFRRISFFLCFFWHPNLGESRSDCGSAKGLFCLITSSSKMYIHDMYIHFGIYMMYVYVYICFYIQKKLVYINVYIGEYTFGKMYLHDIYIHFFHVQKKYIYV